jgi:hypothetical protein
MQMTIALLKEKYGSYEGYIREACGLSEQEIKAIRNLLIVPIRFEEKQLYRARL